jgi:tetratricopeptide (TPR) repeat protein
VRLLFLLIFALGFRIPFVQGQEKPSTVEKEEIDPVEQEYYRILEIDDEALTKIDEWIRASQRPDAPEAKAITLEGKIKAQIRPVREAYESFIVKNPEHARSRLTYASFLTDIGEEHSALTHLIKATEVDPTLPAAWNNLANYYGHHGELKKAFSHYEKAIEISPDESVYYHNFGTTVFLFRKDVKEHYNITENQVFDKALGLYKKAQQLSPKDFDLAEDIAQTYYGIRTTDKPAKMARPQEALASWNLALTLAPSEFEKQGVLIHLARIHIELKDFNEANNTLAKVNLAVYTKLKDRVGRRVPGYQPIAPPSETPTATSEP